VKWMLDPRLAQCHLCENLFAARERWLAFAEKRVELARLNKVLDIAPNNEPDWIKQLRADADDIENSLLAVADPAEGDLCLHCIAGGFPGIRSLRVDNSDVPMVGTHRLLAASAIRQGVGKRMI